VFRGEAEVGSGEADLSGKITLRAAPLLEGENILRVVAYDRLGNPSSAEATITIDYDPDLALGIVKITNGSIFSPQSRGQKMLIEFFLKETAMLSFSVSAAGGAELYSYAAQIQAGSDVQLEWNGQDQSGNWLADGSYNYAVEVEFTTGQRGTRSGVVVVDNTQPDKPHLQYPALASTVTSITPHLKWEEAADAEYYLVMYSNDEQFSDSQVASATGNDYLLELGSQGTYYWKVKAVDLAGNESEWSQTWNFQLGELDRSTFQVANFSMQPNPFSPDQDGVFDELVIGFTLQQPGDVTLTIYNLAGQKVFKRELGELTWGDHQLAWNGKNQQNQRVKKGAYILHLTAKNPNYGAVASIIKHILVLY
jgi:flagellar hook assembly protein FlgD